MTILFVLFAFADLHVHHVRSFAEYPELRLVPDNLVTLCREHHHDRLRKEVVQ